jgi:hypothetical protein
VFDCCSGLPLICSSLSGDSHVKLRDARYILHMKSSSVSRGLARNTDERTRHRYSAQRSVSWRVAHAPKAWRVGMRDS